MRTIELSTIFYNFGASKLQGLSFEIGFCPEKEDHQIETTLEY